METEIVNKTDSIENITDNKFIFCKELNKGFVKKNLNSLGLSDYSFENVINRIEQLSHDQLKSMGCDSVFFENGKEKYSHKTNKFVETTVTDLANKGIKKNNIIAWKDAYRLKNRFFNNSIFDSLFDSLFNSPLDLVSVLNSETKITASDGAAGDYFGNAIVMSDSKIVVGAYGDDNYGKDSGAVYVYDLDGSNEIKITPSDGAAKDYFGNAIAISDSKIVIGAFKADNYGKDSGAVYVYDLDGSNEIKIIPSDGAAGDHFGKAVAISGSKIIVGAYEDDDKGVSSGTVYIYDLDGSNEIKITASDGAANDYFGNAIAVSDSKIVVGAKGDDDKGSGSGSVYVYDLDGSNEFKITASDGAADDWFGIAVAISDSKIVVGAARDNDKGRFTGSAYIYDLDGSNEIKITASDAAAGDWFGYSVAISDSKIVVGANGDDDKGTKSGAVYIYDLDGSNEIKITASDGAANDNFGYAIVMSDSKIVIGASGDHDKGAKSGSVYIYDIK